jgi:hypothetical protein
MTELFQFDFLNLQDFRETALCCSHTIVILTTKQNMEFTPSNAHVATII